MKEGKYLFQEESMLFEQVFEKSLVMLGRHTSFSLTELDGMDIERYYKIIHHLKTSNG